MTQDPLKMIEDWLREWRTKILSTPNYSTDKLLAEIDLRILDIQAIRTKNRFTYCDYTGLVGFVHKSEVPTNE